MEDLIKIFDFAKDFVGPAGLTIIVIVGLICFYFSSKKSQKELSKTSNSIDTSLGVLSNSMLEMNQSNKELIKDLTSSNNSLTKAIVVGVTEALVSMDKQKQNQHDKSLKKSIDNSGIIKQELYTILLATGSDLVVLTQFHNGDTNLNGVPFAKYDIIDQTNSTNSMPLFVQTESRPISEYSLIYRKTVESADNLFWANKNEIDEDYDNSISIRLEKINKSSLICIGLFTDTNTLFAFINIFFNNKRLTEDFVRTLNINRSKYKLENILKKTQKQ